MTLPTPRENGAPPAEWRDRRSNIDTPWERIETDVAHIRRTVDRLADVVYLTFGGLAIFAAVNVVVVPWLQSLMDA